MPKTLPINSPGLKGLNSDIDATELGPEFITSGINFGVAAGAIKASGGNSLWDTPPVNFNAGHIRPVDSANADYWLIAGRSAIYVFDGTTFTDLSSTAGYAGIGADDELLWTSCMLGAIPVLNNPQGVPEYWSPQSPGQIMQPLLFDAGNTWLAKGFSFKVLRSHKNFLFALNLLEGGTELRDSYRWSHPADINGLPFTWDETDLSAIASKESIGGDGGDIIDGRSLRDAFCIYSENAINILDFVGGEFIFKRRELSSTFGLISANCITEVKGQHFFIADGDIVKNDGNSVDSIIHNRIQRRMESNRSADYYNRSFVIRNNNDKEVWFCVPEDGALYPNVAYIYNWKDDSWVIRDLPENLTHAAYGAKTDAPPTWDTIVGNWEDQGGTWGAGGTTPFSKTIIGVLNDSTLQIIDPADGVTTNDYTAMIERLGYKLDSAIDVTTIVRAYPRIKSTQPIQIQFGSQDFPDSPVRWKPVQTFDPNTQRKVDVRTTGEYLCWRIYGNGTPNWRLSGMDIEYESAGKR